VLPIGSSVPRVFQRIQVRFGRPVDLSEFQDRQKNRETAALLMDKVMESIRQLQEEIERSK
jgi:hypothetical protein